MKKTTSLFVFSALVILFSITACYKNEPANPDLPIFSSISDIINPPDSFILAYSLNTYNNYLALLEFEIDAVWEIERLSAPGFITVWIDRTVGENNPELEIINAQNSTSYVGLAGGIRYNFWANRSSGDAAYTTLLLQFTKQDIDYENFTPKI